MKYYLYVSDAKLDMLSGQIAQPILKRLSVEMKIDLKVLGLTVKTPTTTDNRYEKLSIVERALLAADLVGTASAPKGFIRGRMPMRYGIYHERDRDAGRESYRGVQEVVFFGGRNEVEVIGLGGSTRHLIAGEGQGALNVPHWESFAPSLLSFLGKQLSSDFTHDPQYPDGGIADLCVPEIADRDRSVTRFSDDALNAVASFTEFMTGPLSYLEFIARVLKEGPSEDGQQHAILGSPIYVAYAD